VFNKHPSVSPEVRERVWQIALSKHYQPCQAARTLVTRRTNMIGLIISEPITRLFTGPFFPALIQSIAEACNQHKYYLTLVLMTTNTDREALYSQTLHSGQLDGAIATSLVLDDPLLLHLQTSQLPCVLVGHHPGYPQIPSVDVDNVSGARTMTEYLISLGHRRIATITGPLNMISGQERFQGYRQALSQAGIEYDDALTAEGDYTEESGFDAMKRLLRANPTAVFAASDMMAMGAMKALAQTRWRVPEDISVAGYGDAPIATFVEPSLTTMQQVVPDLGRTAAEMLIALLNDPSVVARSQLLPTRLIVRHSTRSIA
jgi:LacI family transcriptional regulator